MTRAAIAHHTHLDLKSTLLSQQPSVDLRLNEWQVPSSEFLKAVAEYASRGREEITRRENIHTQEIKRGEEKKQSIESEITACKVREIKLMEALELERNEKKDAEASVSELKRNYAGIKEKFALLDSEIEQCNTEVMNLRREKQKDMAVLNRHASRLLLETEACEKRLGFRIEGIDVDKLLICFMYIDSQNVDEEYGFVIDIGEPIYKVPISSPPLRNLSMLVEQLNEEKDIYWFIRKMRSIFQEKCKEKGIKTS